MHSLADGGRDADHPPVLTPISPSLQEQPQYPQTGIAAPAKMAGAASAFNALDTAERNFMSGLCQGAQVC